MTKRNVWAVVSRLGEEPPLLRRAGHWPFEARFRETGKRASLIFLTGGSWHLSSTRRIGRWARGFGPFTRLACTSGTTGITEVTESIDAAAPTTGDAMIRGTVRLDWPPVVLSIVLLTLAAPRSASADARFEKISRGIQRLIETGELPSVTVAVARDGRVLWEAAYGWADREQQIRATPRTPYSLASISKPFTATAVMMLAERGQLALDRQANDYLGHGRIGGRDARHATVRRLLTHTAGLPPYFRPFFASDAPAMEDLIARDAILRSRPGRRHVYSNLGYGILEQIITRISGTTYEEYLAREIFGPLGLESASVPRTALSGAALRYDARNQPLPFYDLGHRGASAVFASAHDLVRFGMVHLKQRIHGVAPILKRRTIDEMQRIQTPESREKGYGLGWRVDDDGPGFRRVGHTGGMPGVTTVLMLFPSQGVTVVVLANKRSERVLEIADQVAAAVMPMYGWRLRQTQTRD